MNRFLLLTMCIFASNLSYSESLIMECSWSVISKFEATGKIYGSNPISGTTPGHFASISKELYHVAPENCVAFTKPTSMSLADYQQSFNGYLRPDKINLSCPKGFFPVAEPSWNNTNSTERISGSDRYYLDSFLAKLTCLK